MSGAGAWRTGIAQLFTGAVSLALLSGCAGIIPQTQAPPIRPEAPPPASALLAGIRPGPSVAAFDLEKERAGAALQSFIESCPRLTSRQDSSGLTRPKDWDIACEKAVAWQYNRTPEFFDIYFETAIIGDGQAHVTGYYEPEIEGSRTRLSGYDVPVYAKPDDLVREWHDDIPASERTGRIPLARVANNGKVRPYFTREEIEKGALAGRGLEIGWAADPVEFFFLQIQGSGRLKAPDGSVMRIGYAGQNGRAYTSLGAVMRERGLLGNGPGQYAPSMQGIMRYVREHPAEGRELMRQNQSYVFFTELTGDGPLGALNVPVRGNISVAADPKFVPLGAPVFLSLENAKANGLWIAQDTGGAIKGANRFDTFWGAGENARATAGSMNTRGQALILLPKGTLHRLGAE